MHPQWWTSIPLTCWLLERMVSFHPHWLPQLWPWVCSTQWRYSPLQSPNQPSKMWDKNLLAKKIIACDIKHWSNFHNAGNNMMYRCQSRNNWCWNFDHKTGCIVNSWYWYQTLVTVREDNLCVLLYGYAPAINMCHKFSVIDISTAEDSLVSEVMAM